MERINKMEPDCSLEILKTLPNVIDLFAGVGGLSLGALRAGFSMALAIESDKHAIAAHKKNFPSSNHSSADISKLTGPDLLKWAGLQRGQLHGLIGGPPIPMTPIPTRFLPFFSIEI